MPQRLNVYKVKNMESSASIHQKIMSSMYNKIQKKMEKAFIEKHTLGSYAALPPTQLVALWLP